MHRTQTYAYAGFLPRFWAHLVDSLILTLATSAVSYGISGILAVVGYPIDENAIWIQVFEVLLYLAFCVPYFVLWQSRMGTTLGKKLLKVAIYDRDSLRPITIRQAWIRFFGYGLSYLLVGMGYVLAALHPEKRALHDLLANTVVLRRKTSS